MAQLPHLVYEQKPPMSSKDFKDLAKPLLFKKDMILLEALSLEFKEFSKTGCRFIDSWHEWESDLRIYIARQRMVKLKKDNIDIPEPTAFHLEASATATKASDEHSPLEAEIIIDKARWNAIEGFTGNDYFDRSNVFAYYLKLLILERRQAFDPEIGFAEYKSLYASIVESGQVSRGEFK